MSVIRFKKAFHTSAAGLHFNNAGLCPISAPARKAIHYWADRLYREGYSTNDEYLEEVENSRTKLATLLGCNSGQVAFFQSTAFAISQIAFGMKLSPGDEIIVWDQEYGANLYPWQSAAFLAGA